MTFIEAAVTLLREAGKPIPVDELCALALKKKLLTKPGKNPLRSLKGRLTTELKKGDASRVEQVTTGVWCARRSEEQTGVAAASSPRAADPQFGHKKNRNTKDGIQELENLYADEIAADGPLSAYLEYEDAQTPDEDRPLRPEIVPPRREHRHRGRNARLSSRGGGRERDDARRKRDSSRSLSAASRSESNGNSSRAKRGGRAQRPPIEAQERRAQQTASETRSLRASAIRVQTKKQTLADGAALVLSQTKDGRPLPVRQLSQMMHRRQLVVSDEEQQSIAIRVELEAENRDRVAQGARPRFFRRGRDQFGLNQRRLAPALVDAENTATMALQALRDATCLQLQDALGQLGWESMERLVGLYLTRRGWVDVEWIKRTPHAHYALGVSPALGVSAQGQGQRLVGICVGNQMIERSSIGELRVGVQVKNLKGGILIAPTGLSEDAKEELEKASGAIELDCGDSFVRNLVEVGLCVTVLPAPAVYLDVDFLDELRNE